MMNEFREEVSCKHSEEDFNAPKHILFEFRMQKLQGFKVLLVDDPKLVTWKLDVKLVTNSQINMYL
jgi:hypothetical protein